MFRPLLIYGIATSLYRAVWSSSITVFSDAGCTVPIGELQGPNGYTDGQCSRLGSGGDFLSFEVSDLDDGCNGVSCYVHVDGEEASRRPCEVKLTLYADSDNLQQ